MSPLRTVGFAVAVWLAAAEPAPAQIASVSVRSVDALIADVQYLAPLVGEEDAVKTMKKVLDRGIEGIDRNKPLGLYVLWPEKIGKIEDLKFPIVCFVPVSDGKHFLETLGKHGIKVSKGEGDTHNVTAGDKVKLTLRLANGHAYAAEKAKWLKGPLPLPSTFLPADASKSALVVNLRTEQLPKEKTQLFDVVLAPIKEIMAALIDEGKKKPGESDEQYRTRLAMAAQFKQFPERYRDGMVWFVEQTQAITVQLDIAPKEGQFSLGVSLKPRQGGDLASFCEYAATGRSDFLPLLKKADMGLLIRFPPPRGMDRKDRALSPDAIARFARYLNVPAGVREAFGKFVAVFFGTFISEGLNAAILVSTPEKGEPEVVIGMKVKEGRKLDAALRDLYKNAPADEKKQFPINWNHDRHGTARIHHVRVPDMKEEIYLAVRDDVLAIADKDSLKFLKATLDALPGKEALPVPLLYARMGGKYLLAEPDFRKIVDKTLSATERDNLSAELNLTGGKELALRVRVSAPLVRVLARVVKE